MFFMFLVVSNDDLISLFALSVGDSNGKRGWGKNPPAIMFVLERLVPKRGRLYSPG